MAIPESIALATATAVCAVVLAGAQCSPATKPRDRLVYTSCTLYKSWRVARPSGANPRIKANAKMSGPMLRYRLWLGAKDLKKIAE